LYERIFSIFKVEKTAIHIFSYIHFMFRSVSYRYEMHMLILDVNRVARSVQCLTTDWTAGVQSPTEAEDFSSTLCSQTGSGAHPAFYTMGTGGSFSEDKARPGRDADHSPPSSAEVKKE
jgi:hypothetical protein